MVPSIPRKKIQDAKANDFFNTILKVVQNAANGKSDLEVTSKLKYKFEDAGAIMVDGSAGAIEVTASDADADATVIMTLDTFKKLQTKELDAMSAMGSGLMKIEGNMGLLMMAQPLMKAMGEEFKKMNDA